MFMSPLKNRLSKDFSLRSLINKYTIAIMLFICWLTFFDRYSLLTQYRLSQTLTALEDEQKNYEDQWQNDDCASSRPKN